MKKLLFLVFILIVSDSVARAHVLEELWNKYAPRTTAGNVAQKALVTPGAIIGTPQGTGKSAFGRHWKYRSGVYEMHYENSENLARNIYGLALYANDISPDLPPEKFYGGVLGFHYSAIQIAGWLNAVLKAGMALNPQENVFAGLMLGEGIVRIGKHGFEPGDVIGHVLGAAPGKKRSFDQNLRHERLHVFWDEDEQMRDAANTAWKALSEAEKENIRHDLRNYAQNNEKQLIEEWAIKEAEKLDTSID